MPWFQVDDQLGFHPKAIAAGNAAMGLWVRAGSWCALHFTEGFVPSDIARSMGTAAQIKRLVDAGLWTASKGGYSFHQWGDRQLSKEQIEERRQKRVDAGRKGGQRSGESRRGSSKSSSETSSNAEALASAFDAASATAGAQADAQQTLEQKRTPVLVPVLDGGYLEGVSLVPNARENEPPPRSCTKHRTLDPDCADCASVNADREAWLGGLIAATEPVSTCARHPGGTEVPCRECQTARERHNLWRRDRERAVDERKRTAAAAKSDAARSVADLKRRAVANCPLGCSELDGYLDDGRGGRALCDHRPPNPDRPSLREQFEAHKRDQSPTEPEPENATPTPEDSHA